MKVHKSEIKLNPLTPGVQLKVKHTNPSLGVCEDNFTPLLVFP